MFDWGEARILRPVTSSGGRPAGHAARPQHEEYLDDRRDPRGALRVADARLCRRHEQRGRSVPVAGILLLERKKRELWPQRDAIVF